MSESVEPVVVPSFEAAAGAIAFAGLGRLASAEAEHRAREQDLAFRITASLPVHAWPYALAEVDRRAAVFADIRQSSPSSGEHPRVAALESVLHDAIHGRMS